MDSKEIIVLGAGVIGLTTALKIQERGRYRVTIIAEVLPTDPKSIRYTSQWAGAHHVSFVQLDDSRHPLDRQTFQEMWKLSADSGEAAGCFMRLHQEEYFGYARSSPSPLEHMPQFRSLAKEELIDGAESGESFDTVTIDVPAYLNYLHSRFLSKGGRIVRGSVQHIAQVAEAGAFPFLDSEEQKRASNHRAPDAIVVCVGIGARFLGGVEDKDVYPIRGQTVLIKAPWVKSGRTFSKGNGWTYVIPRPSGTVILGGTLEENDWYPHARPATTRDILERTLKMYPDLVPPELRKGEKPSVNDILPLVIEEGCGFRPARKGGLRLEADEITIPFEDRKIPVVYNYGHAGAGYIASFGSAEVALKLLEEKLNTGAGKA